MQQEKRICSRAKSCFTVRDDHPELKPNPKGISKTTEGRTWKSKDRAVTDSWEKFPYVIEKGNERPETKVIEDDVKARNDFDLWERSDEEDDYVPQSDGNDLWNNEPDLKSDQPMKIRKVGALGKSDAKKSNGSAPQKAGKHNISRVEHGASSELSTSQFQLFGDTAPLQLPAG